MKLETVSRPLLRYHGGKWRLAPWIISHFPDHRCYVEPYGGGASILLRKPRAYAEIYNDLDTEIVNLFRVVRDRGEALVRAVELTPYAREDFNESYFPSADSLEQARRTLARAAMGFGTNTFRPNKNGSTCRTGFRSCTTRRYTTPALDWRNYPEALVAIIARLQGVIIENRDALTVMRSHDAFDTLHYVDPPYLPETRNVGKDYRHEMTEADHRELAEFLQTLKGRVIVSGYSTPLYKSLFRGWKTVSCRAMADGAGERTEVLWMRNVEGDLFS